MPPRPRTDSIRNPATSVPIRVEALSSRGPAIIRPASEADAETDGGAAKGPSTHDAAGRACLPSRFLGVENDRDRAVVDELDPHARAEDARFDRDAQFPKRGAEALVEQSRLIGRGCLREAR